MGACATLGMSNKGALSEDLSLTLSQTPLSRGLHMNCAINLV